MSAGDGERQRFTFLPDPEGGMSSSRSGVEILKLPLVGAELEVPVRSGANPLIIGSSPEAAKLPLPFGSDNRDVAVVIAKGLALVGIVADGDIAIVDGGAFGSGMTCVSDDGVAIVFTDQMQSRKDKRNRRLS